MWLLTFGEGINEIGVGEEGLVGFFDIVVRHVIVIVHVIDGTFSIAVAILFLFFEVIFIVLLDPAVGVGDLILCYSYKSWLVVSRQCFSFAHENHIEIGIVSNTTSKLE